MRLVQAYRTSYLVKCSASENIVQADTLRDALSCIIKSLSLTNVTAKDFICTMVKRSISLSGGERVISQVKFPIKQKTLDAVLSAL